MLGAMPAIAAAFVLGAFFWLTTSAPEAAEPDDGATRAYAEYVERARNNFLDRVRAAPAGAEVTGASNDGRPVGRPAREDGIVTVPGGLVHHWVATGFTPGATLRQVLGVSSDYPEYRTIYKPIIGSTLLSRSGDTFRVLLRIREGAAGVTAVLDIWLTIQVLLSGRSPCLLHLDLRGHPRGQERGPDRRAAPASGAGQRVLVAGRSVHQFRSIRERRPRRDGNARFEPPLSGAAWVDPRAGGEKARTQERRDLFGRIPHRGGCRPTGRGRRPLMQDLGWPRCRSAWSQRFAPAGRSRSQSFCSGSMRRSSPRASVNQRSSSLCRIPRWPFSRRVWIACSSATLRYSASSGPVRQSPTRPQYGGFPTVRDPRRPVRPSNSRRCWPSRLASRVRSRSMPCRFTFRRPRSVGHCRLPVPSGRCRQG